MEVPPKHFQVIHEADPLEKQPNTAVQSFWGCYLSLREKMNPSSFQCENLPFADP
jgi:hypothetical protein